MSFHKDPKGARFSRRHYDSDGYRSGYSRPNLCGGYVDYDRKGRRVGYSRKNSEGGYDHYRNGRLVGSSGEEDYMDCYE